ncbi:MAG TPA: hypothetical protein VFZ65_01545 [Planctomycetota bacterium]|nr:hypothetical protein [Planctomycetota bacterium]
MNIKATFDEQSSAPAKPALARGAPGAPSCAARNLALAYKIDDLIERGLIADYSAAARLLQVSQPRLTHLMALRLLAPGIQEAILFGDLTFGDKELRALARVADWDQQKVVVAARTASPRRRTSVRA